MRILDVINLRGANLSDQNWLERLKTPGLTGCFCLLGSKDAEICVDDGQACRFLDSGQLVLLPPGDIIRLESRSGAHGSGVHESSFVGAVFFKIENSSPLENIIQLLLRQREALFSDDIVSFYEKLYGHFAGQGVFTMQAAYHSLAAFLYDLAERVDANPVAHGDGVSLERVLELMNIRIYGRLNLKELADEVHVSEAHLIRLFKQQVQMPPMKYFMRLKIHTAAKMITQGMKIKDVADFTGFYNDAHFSKQFKQYMGVPPKEYKAYTAESQKSSRTPFSFLTSVLSDFIDAIPDMVFFKDTFYVYRLCNTAFSKYVGLSKEDICGQTDFTIFPRTIAEDYRRYDSRVMQLNKAIANEEWVVYPDGSSFLLEAYKAPFVGPDQKLLGLVGVCRDITVRGELVASETPEIP